MENTVNNFANRWEKDLKLPIYVTQAAKPMTLLICWPDFTLEVSIYILLIKLTMELLVMLIP